MDKFKCYTITYKRHLTSDAAEALKKEWDYDGENEKRVSKILYKQKTNDYTAVLGKYYN